jgi:RNA polymerase-interacting CarD/CdnL/TRCF family regulator
MLNAQIIDPMQYLERLPKGIIPKITELLDDLRKNKEAATESQGNKSEMIKNFAEQYPQEYEQFSQLSPEQQEAMINQITGGI